MAPARRVRGAACAAGGCHDRARPGSTYQAVFALKDALAAGLVDGSRLLVAGAGDFSHDRAWPRLQPVAHWPPTARTPAGASPVSRFARVRT